MATDIDYPETLPPALPIPLRDGYGYQSGDPTARIEFSRTGHVREIYSDAPESFASVGFLFTAAQWMYFQAWHRWELKAGTLWFNLRIRAAGSLELRECRFVSEPDYTPVGATHARVTVAVETRAGSQMTLAEFEALS